MSDVPGRIGIGGFPKVGFQMDVDGAAGIPAGIDGRKLRQSVLVRQLNSAEKACFVDLPGTAPWPARPACAGRRRPKSIGIKVRRRPARAWTTSTTRTPSAAGSAIRALGGKSGINAERI